MKKIILLITGILLLASCATPEQLAQRHLKKAIKLDPDIVKKYKTDTLVKGVAEGTVKITTPQSEGEFGFDCDSLKKLVDAYRNNSLPKGGVLVHQDSNVNVSIKKDSAGKFSIKYVVKPKNIYVPVKVPYEVKVSVPGKTVTIYKSAPFYTYGWFWGLLTACVVELFLLLRPRIKSL